MPRKTRSRYRGEQTARNPQTSCFSVCFAIGVTLTGTALPFWAEAPPRAECSLMCLFELLCIVSKLIFTTCA